MSDTNQYNYKSLDDGTAPVVDVGPELAGRGQRLGASIIDTLIAITIYFPLTFLLTGHWGGTPKTANPGSGWEYLLYVNSFDFDTIGLSILGMCIVIALQSWFIYTKGQTIGKMAVHIAICTHQTPEKAAYGQIVLKRMLLIDIISFVPVLGMVFSLVDTLCIFRADRRCLHDHIANTWVVKV